MGLQKFIKKHRYKMKHGEQAWEKRHIVESFKVVLTENHIDYNRLGMQYHSPEAVIAYCITKSGKFSFYRFLRHMNHICNEDWYQEDKDYNWLIEAKFEFKYIKDIIEFNQLFNRRNELQEDMNRIEEVVSNNRDSVEVVNEFELMKNELKELTSKLHSIINPVSKKVKSGQSLQESIIAFTNESLQKPHEQSIKSTNEETYQIEIIRQLDEVINDERVSETNRKEAQATKSLILKISETEREKTEIERVNDNAQIIIHASQAFHFNKKQKQELIEMVNK